MQIRVLLVDDHCILRDGLLQLLEGQEGIEVVGQAADGNEAISEARRLGPDVVVMDVTMPGMDGISATRALSRAMPATQVLMLSMHESPDIVLQALEAGARGYLSKSSAAAELVKAVRALASGRRYLGSGIAEEVLDNLQAPRAAGSLGALTDTERRILQLTAEGKSNAEMAGILSLSHRTVETYRLLMMRKLGIRGLPALVKFAIRHGITTVD
jgi:DNA-binding NarL/FixJ family response regulator